MTHLNAMGLFKIYIYFFLFLQNNQASKNNTASYSNYTHSLIYLDSPESVKTDFIILSSNRKWMQCLCFLYRFYSLLWGNAQGCESTNTLSFGKNLFEVVSRESCGSVGQLPY